MFFSMGRSVQLDPGRTGSFPFLAFFPLPHRSNSVLRCRTTPIRVLGHYFPGRLSRSPVQLALPFHLRSDSASLTFSLPSQISGSFPHRARSLETRWSPSFFSRVIRGQISFIHTQPRCPSPPSVPPPARCGSQQRGSSEGFLCVLGGGFFPL